MLGGKDKITKNHIKWFCWKHKYSEENYLRVKRWSNKNNWELNWEIYRAIRSTQNKIKGVRWTGLGNW